MRALARMQVRGSRVRRLSGTVLAAALWASPAAAQWEDALVLPPGIVRVQGGGSFTVYDARFGSPLAAESRGHQPLGASFLAVLTSQVYSPLQLLQSDLNSFFAATAELGGPFEVGPENLFLHTTRLHATADQREAALEIALGVVPRVQVGVRVPIVQNWLEVQQFGLGEGTVGLNPDPAFNRALLEQLGSGLGEIGARRFLPIRNSAVGRALQDRLLAAGIEDELRLPESSLSEVGIGGLSPTEVLRTGRFDPARIGWAPGDGEVNVRVQLLNTLAGGESPSPLATSGFRSAIALGIRLPTGRAPNADYLVFPLPRQGFTGAYLRLDSDLIASPRLGGTVTLLWEAVRPVDTQQRVWTEDDQFPPQLTTRPLRWSPGTRLSLALMPRVRLVDEIAVVARYRFERAGAEVYVARQTVPLGEGELLAPFQLEARFEAPVTAHQLGIGIEFSTLGAALAGQGTLPFEVGLYLRDTVAGVGGAADARVIEAVGRVYYPLWEQR